MKILFITHTRIGDAVLSSGLLSHLVRRYPEARVTLVCGAIPAPLFAATPGVSRLIPLIKQSFKRHWLRLWSETVGSYWDLVVDLRDSAVSRAVLAGERRILGRAREPLHRVRHLGHLLDLEPPPAPRLWLPEAARARARALLPEGGPVLALGASANWPGKAWPAARFAELARRLTAADGILPEARVAVLGGPGERDAAGPLIASIPEARCLDLVGGVDLATAAACLARATLFVGNDSGLMHIAAAMDISTLGLFGPSPEALYAPWGENAASVRGRRTYEEIAADPAFDPSVDGPWMEDLDVDADEAAATALWRRTVEA